MQLLWFEKCVLRFGLLHERETYQRNPSSRDKSLLGCTLFSRAKLRLSVSAASIRTSIYPWTASMHQRKIYGSQVAYGKTQSRGFRERRVFCENPYSSIFFCYM